MAQGKSSWARGRKVGSIPREEKKRLRSAAGRKSSGLSAFEEEEERSVISTSVWREGEAHHLCYDRGGRLTHLLGKGKEERPMEIAPYAWIKGGGKGDLLPRTEKTLS